MVEKGNPQTDFNLDGESVSGGGIAALPERLSRYGKGHRRALLMADYATEHGDVKIASQLENCGTYLLFREYYTIDKVRLHAAKTCKKHLLCPFCAIRRGAKMVKAYLDRLKVINSGFAPGQQPKPYLVTFTVKDGADLKERFNHLQTSVHKLLKKRHADKGREKGEVGKAVGAVWSYEFKRGSGSGLWHPHVHAVWLCHEEPDQEALSEQWKHITGDSHIVDVRPFHDDQDVLTGFLEVFKYAVKFSDMPLKDNWDGYKLLSRKRLIGSFGLFWGVEVPEDLTDEPIWDDLPYIERLYRYFDHGYSLVHVSEPMQPDISRNTEKPTKGELIKLRVEQTRQEIRRHFKRCSDRRNQRLSMEAKKVGRLSDSFDPDP